MTQVSLQAGSSVESMCKRCKTVTDHHIVVMDGEKIVKVECKVCGGRHVYRPATPTATSSSKKADAPKTPRKVSSSRKTSVSVEAAWEKAVGDAENPVRYAMDAVLQDGDVCKHPTFGLGHVQRHIAANTVEVLFQDGLKNLRCAPRS